MTGLHRLFPRVMEHLNDSGKSTVDITSPEMDGMWPLEMVQYALVEWR